MPHRPKPATPCLGCILAWLSAPLISTLHAQPDPEPDPWFDEQAAREQSGETSSEPSEEDVGGPPRIRSASAVYRNLLEDYRSAADGDLTRRLAALRKIVSASPRYAGEIMPELQELERQWRSVQQALSNVASPTLGLIDGLQLLSKHAPYFTGDPSLAIALLDSPFTQRLKSEVRHSSEAGDFATVDALEQAINRSGLDSLLGSRLQSWRAHSMREAIQRRWQRSAASHPLPAQDYVLGKLLGDPAPKLTLAVDFHGQPSPLLARNLRRSLQRKWGSEIELAVDDERDPKDLRLEVLSSVIETEVATSQQKADSVIPGKVEESVNPEFLALVEKYEKEAKRYQTALATYETLMEIHIQQVADEQSSGLQGDLEQAEVRMEEAEQAFQNAIQAATEEGGPMPVLDTAPREAFETLQRISNSQTGNTIPKPTKPYPHHLDLLEEIDLMPSTLITSEQETPYQYTAKELTYHFNGQARFALASPSQGPLTDTTEVSLQHSTQWTQNEGVHARDPSVNQGTFSQAELDSTLNLFTLEVGSRCASQVQALLKQAQQKLAASLSQDPSLDRALLLLGVTQLAQPSQMRPLPQSTVSQLARLARDPSLSDAEFRQRCLAAIVRHSPLDDNVIHRLLADLGES